MTESGHQAGDDAKARDRPVLGRGRFSTVCAEAVGGSSVAVKYVDLDMLRPPHSWEAELAALERVRGRCANVVAPLSWSVEGAIEPRGRLVMPLLPLTLDHVLFAHAKAKYPPGSGWRNALDHARVRQIAAGIANALGALHALGIIHRDVKPENILFNSTEQDAEPVLCDFGVAWVPGLGEDPKVCDVSTAEYKAPELLFGVTKYGPAVDVWAFGCVLAKLASHDCAAPFTPYTCDLALIAAQCETLGSPDLAQCPSLRGTSAEMVATCKGAGLRLRFEGELTAKLLAWEPTVRPTAADLQVQLSLAAN